LTPGKHIFKVLCEILFLKLPMLRGNLTDPRQYSLCVHGYIESSDVLSHIFQFNHLTPNGHYMGRTAQLTSRCCILYFIQQIYVLNILNMLH